MLPGRALPAVGLKVPVRLASKTSPDLSQSVQLARRTSDAPER